MGTIDEVLYNQPSYEADLFITALPDGDRLAGRVFSRPGALRLDAAPSPPPESVTGARANPAPRGVSVLVRIGQPMALVIPYVGGYAEFPSGSGDGQLLVRPSLGVVFPAFWIDDTLAKKPVRDDMGTEVIDGYHCAKVRCSNPASADVTYLWAASDLSGLVIKLVAQQGDTARGLALRDVRLGADDAVFSIPDVYQCLDSVSAPSPDDT